MSWTDGVQAGAAVSGVFVAAGGLGLVYSTLVQQRKQQRLETGPYLRIDIAPAVGTDDFLPPKPHFDNTGDVEEVGPASSNNDKVEFCAWIRNYQTHPLGVALHVRALFIAEVEQMGDRAAEAMVELVYREFLIAYVEHDKPIKLRLFRVPRSWNATVKLSALTYLDFYRERHEHSDPERSKTPLHGRLECVYANGRFSSVPVSRPERD